MEQTFLSLSCLLLRVYVFILLYGEIHMRPDGLRPIRLLYTRLEINTSESNQ